MARKSTTHNTSVGVKFYIQDDTQKLQLDDIDNVSPAFNDIEWTTEDDFELETGETIEKKTIKNKKDFTFNFKHTDQSANEGFAMAEIYAEEEGEKEQVYIIAEVSNDVQYAIRGTIKSITHGDYNNALRKPSFVLAGNACAVPNAPLA